MGGEYDRVAEYNPLTNTWRNMPSLQQKRYGHSVCTLDNKIFVLGGDGGYTCEMLDLSDDDPHWRYIAEMNRRHYDGGAMVIKGKIYVLGGRTTNVEVYDVDQGKMMKYSQMIIYTNIRTVSVKHFLSFRNHTQGNGRTSYILLQVMN